MPIGGFLGGLGNIFGATDEAQWRGARAMLAQEELRQAQQQGQLLAYLPQLLAAAAQQQPTGIQQASGQDITSAATSPPSPAGAPMAQLPAVPAMGIGGGPSWPQAPSYASAPSSADLYGPSGRGWASGIQDPRAAMIIRDESGGRNVPNYRFDPGHTASGLSQITDTTWNRYAPGVGAPQLSYPASAMDRPVSEQLKVTDAILKKEGPAPWANYNPKLRADLARASQAIQLDGQSLARVAGPEAAGQAANVANAALPHIDPSEMFRASIRTVVDAVDKGMPEAPPALKGAAVMLMMRVMAPQDQMMMRYMMQQNRDNLMLSLAEMRGTQADIRQQRGIEAAETRQQQSIEAAEARQSRGIEASEKRQERALEAAESRQETAIEARKQLQAHAQDRIDARSLRSQQARLNPDRKLKFDALKDLYNQAEQDIRAYVAANPGKDMTSDETYGRLVEQRDDLQREMNALAGRSTATVKTLPPSAETEAGVAR